MNSKTFKKLEITANVLGHSMPLWWYSFLPQGMRPATKRDLYSGHAVLYKAEPPDEGYFTDYVRPATRQTLLDMIDRQWPVYVKE